MERKQQRLDALLSKLQWQPLQVYVKHYQSAEMDLSAVAVAYYLMLTAFPLIVIAANIFPYLNLDISVLLSFMEKNLPTNIYPTVSAITTDIFLLIDIFNFIYGKYKCNKILNQTHKIQRIS